MEFQAGKDRYLQVKVDPRGGDLSRFSHPALLKVYPLEDFWLLVFDPGDVNGVLRALLDFDPKIEILEAGLTPMADPLVGYRKEYTPRLRIVSPGPGITPQAQDLMVKSRFSFGSGFHPTTELCVYLLEEAFSKQKDLKIVFDLGTGSGILALCAARLGAEKILAVDIDYRSCLEAQQNVKLNRFHSQIAVVCGSIECARKESFDLLLANLTIGTILTLAPQMTLPLKKEGLLILSGFVSAQTKDVLASFPQTEILAQRELEGWAALLLRLRS